MMTTYKISFYRRQGFAHSQLHILPRIGTNIFHQIIDAAMGCSFIVVYAIIHMVYIETPIVCKFQQNYDISMYKQLIEDGILGWHGLEKDFSLVSGKFQLHLRSRPIYQGDVDSIIFEG